MSNDAKSDEESRQKLGLPPCRFLALLVTVLDCYVRNVRGLDASSKAGIFAMAKECDIDPIALWKAVVDLAELLPQEDRS